jgi:hypothetical protein
MPDQWIHEHAGTELQPRAGFEEELGSTLRDAWAGRPARVPVMSPAGRRVRWWMPVSWAAAVLAVVAGVAIVIAQDRPTSGPSASTDVPSTAPTPTTAVPATSSTSVVAPTIVPVVPSTPEEQAVLDYLTALAEGRYLDAAQVLGEGGLEWEARADLRPLFVPHLAGGLEVGQYDTAALAGALQRWCDLPALCLPPAALSSSGAQVIATFPEVDGVAVSVSFVAGTFEGASSVHGLPLRLPPAGGSMADVVPCPTDPDRPVAYADLDGDGWMERIVVEHASDSAPYRVHVCGTALVVEPLEVSSDVRPLSVLAVSVAGTGELLIGGSTASGTALTPYRLAAGSLQSTGHTVVTVTPDASPDGAGVSIGCADPGAGEQLFEFTYHYVDGTDLSNSTSLDVTAVPLLDGGVRGEPSRLVYALPADVDAAFRVLAGSCAGLPVQTG